MFDKSKNIAGQKFGMLTAIRQTSVRGKNAIWEYRCDCGELVEKARKNVGEKPKQQKSCGCAVGRFDLTGQRFNSFSVIGRAGNDKYNRSATWNCICDCGQKRIYTTSELKNGFVKSCGCLNGERHGESNPPTVEYRTWHAMIGRCHNPESKQYKNYGARGIIVCDDWRESYLSFLSHIGRRPSESHSIGRIDNDGNYEPGNVRWETVEQQRNNTRANVFIEFDGITMTCAQWDSKLGLPKGMTLGRVNRGWSVERALTTPCSFGKHTKPITRQ